MKQIIAAIFLTIFILTFSVVFTLNFRPLYYHDITTLKIEHTSGFSKKQILENYNTLIDYNCIFHQNPLKLTLPMSKEGRLHFEEVKHIFDFLQLLCLISAVGLLLLCKNAISKHNYKFFILSSICTFFVPTAFAIIFAINGWENTFTFFHKILFQNDYWLFDEFTNPIIKILPDVFFFHYTIMILCLVLTGIFINFLLYLFFRKKKSL